MSRVRQFKLPDLGEGLTEGEILQWMVGPGDTVKLNQPIVEVETAKAAVEVPSPFAGVVLEIHHPAGETVDVGSPIITFDTDPTAGPLEGVPAAGDVLAAATPTESAAVRDADAVGTPGEIAADAVPPQVADSLDAAGTQADPPSAARTPNLVGYGPRSASVHRRARKPAAPPAEPPSAASASAVAPAGAAGDAPAVLAKPPVRKLARQLGVDITAVTGSGPDGTITRDDVQAAAGNRTGAAATTVGPDLAAGRASEARPAREDAETRIPVKGVRKHTAAAMVASAFTAPHVTEFITLDMTRTMEMRTRVQAMPEFRGVKVTSLLFVARALLFAVRRNPGVNSRWDEAAQEIVVKNYVNLGIAAATPRGLLVPNVKDAHRLSLLDLARALQDLTETARAGKTTPAGMAGGTITITNVGTFGVDNGTPIINPGESAILCFGAVRPTPWVVDGQIVARQVTQLSLSFDHRNVDGQLGSQFLADIASVLSDPANTALF